MKVEVDVEGPRDVINDGRISQYTTEAVLFDSFSSADNSYEDFEMPAEAAHLQPEHLDNASIGCHAHTILTGQLKHPKLWSAEQVNSYPQYHNFVIEHEADFSRVNKLKLYNLHNSFGGCCNVVLCILVMISQMFIHSARLYKIDCWIKFSLVICSHTCTHLFSY